MMTLEEMRDFKVKKWQERLATHQQGLQGLNSGRLRWLDENGSVDEVHIAKSKAWCTFHIAECEDALRWYNGTMEGEPDFSVSEALRPLEP